MSYRLSYIFIFVVSYETILDFESLFSDASVTHTVCMQCYFDPSPFLLTFGDWSKVKSTSFLTGAYDRPLKC